MIVGLMIVITHHDFKSMLIKLWYVIQIHFIDLCHLNLDFNKNPYLKNVLHHEDKEILSIDISFTLALDKLLNT